MDIDDVFDGFMDLVSSGEIDLCACCGKKKRGETAIVTTVDNEGEEFMECICYECLKSMPVGDKGGSK